MSPGRLGLRIVPTKRFLEDQTRNAAYLEQRLQRTLPILEFKVQVRDELRRARSGKQNLVVRK